MATPSCLPLWFADISHQFGGNWLAIHDLEQLQGCSTKNRVVYHIDTISTNAVSKSEKLDLGQQAASSLRLLKAHSIASLKNDCCRREEKAMYCIATLRGTNMFSSIWRAIVSPVQKDESESRVISSPRALNQTPPWERLQSRESVASNSGETETFVQGVGMRSVS